MESSEAADIKYAPRTIIESGAPLDIQDLKHVFNDRDSVYYLIDYDQSSLKEKGLLFYLSNLEIPGDIVFSEETPLEDKFTTIKSYMEISNLIDAPTLAATVASLLFRYKGLDEQVVENPIFTEEESDLFIEQNKELMDRWCLFMDSLFIYALYVFYQSEMIKEATKDGEEDPILPPNPVQQAVPEIDNSAFIGHNLIYVCGQEGFYEWYFSIELPDIRNMRFFTHQFTEYCFKGNNLFHYFIENGNWLLAAVQTFLTEITREQLIEFLEKPLVTLDELEPESAEVS